MRKKPYLIDGIIGNGNMLLAFNKAGNIERLSWPRIDYIDQVNHQWTGIHEQGAEKTSFFHDESFTNEQFYLEDTNVLVTRNARDDWHIEQTDYVLPSQDVWVRDCVIKNNTSEEKTIALVHFSDAALDGQKNFQTTKFDLDNDSLIHYYRQTALAITSSAKISLYQAGKAKEQAEMNRMEGRDILNNPEGAISIDAGVVKPGETKKVTLYISLANTEKEAVSSILEAKRLGEKQLRKKTVDYWTAILDEREKLSIKSDKVNELYKRSILTFHLLQNKETGAFIAGPEVDEEYDYSGGYAYCWGRDAAFIASAVDAAGYHDLVSKFYQFKTAIQSEDGSWDQRYYTDGVLAPTWGMQVDEIGSIVWGMNHHYQLTKDESFRKDTWPSVKRGADFLCGFIDPETNLPMPSKDLWEKRTGEHLYSTAAVYGGLMGAADYAELEQQQELADQYRDKALKMKEAAETIGWNEREQRFVRSLKLTVTGDRYEEEKNAGGKVLFKENGKGVKEYMIWEDTTPDISLLGLHYPFAMIGQTEDKLAKTAHAIETTCTSRHVGGIERFPGDVYIGGNPWLISTLWLAIYKLRSDETDQALELFNWTTDHANHLGLMPEQIDKETDEPAWVMPLTWSHAMYVLTLKELAAKNLI
ncbi:glycoside hydrolase family 15 protein [Sediminibacillus massiliensis]|uniref:glycoside hydrolase family 15 protein n=1 Tax=Sediminibacillus massiliensis TaxID=1926277 RepID=UPI00098848B1|nr:glycoside hydrolase family 15 protein [Sediminibacillus massiliensis]